MTWVEDALDALEEWPPEDWNEHASVEEQERRYETEPFDEAE